MSNIDKSVGNSSPPNDNKCKFEGGSKKEFQYVQLHVYILDKIRSWTILDNRMYFKFYQHINSMY